MKIFGKSQYINKSLTTYENFKGTKHVANPVPEVPLTQARVTETECHPTNGSIRTEVLSSVTWNLKTVRTVTKTWTGRKNNDITVQDSSTDVYRSGVR